MVQLKTAEEMEAALEEFKAPAPALPVEYVAPDTKDEVLPPADPRILAEEEAYEFDGTLKALEAAKDQAPALHEKALKHAELYGLPMDLIMRNIDVVDQKDRLRRLRGALRTNKQLEDWFYEGDNSQSITIDDFEKMGNVAWVFQAGPAAYEYGTDQLRMGDIRWRQMVNPSSVTADELIEAERIESRSDNDFGADGWVGSGFVGAAKQLPNMVDIGLAGLEGGIKGAIAGGGVGAAFGPAGAVSGAGSVGSATAIAYTAGQSFKVNAGQTYAEFRRIRNRDGKPLENDVAVGAAMIAALPIAALDTLGLGATLKIIAPLQQLEKYGTKAAVKEALKHKGFLQLAGAVGKRLALAVGVETATEPTQELISIIGAEAAKSVSNVGNFAPSDPEANKERLLDVTKQTLLSMLFLGGVPAAGRLAADMTFAGKAETDAHKLTALSELAKNDKLVKTNPAKAEEVLTAALDGTDHDTVYISTDAVQQFLQADEDVAAAFSKIPDIQQKVAEAKQSGGDVAIPAAQFYAYIAPTDAAATVIDQLKFSPAGMSKKDADNFMKAFMKAVDAKSKSDPTEELADVAADVYEKLRAVGYTPDQARQHATLYGAFFDTMSTQTKIPSREIYDSYNIQFDRTDQNTAEPGSLTQKTPDFIDPLLDDIELVSKKHFKDLFLEGKLTPDVDPSFMPVGRQTRVVRQVPKLKGRQTQVKLPHSGRFKFITAIDELANKGLSMADQVKGLIHQYGLENDPIYSQLSTFDPKTMSAQERAQFEASSARLVDEVYEGMRKERGSVGAPRLNEERVSVPGRVTQGQKGSPASIEQATLAQFVLIQTKGKLEPQRWREKFRRTLYPRRRPRGGPRNLVNVLDRGVNDGLAVEDIARSVVHAYAMQKSVSYAKAITGKIFANMDPNEVPLPEVSARKGIVIGAWEQLRDEVAKFGPPIETSFKQEEIDLVAGPDGKPIILYHGSSQAFDKFDADKRGSATQAPSAKEGFFFTTRRKTAEYYSKMKAGATSERNAKLDRKALEREIRHYTQTGNTVKVAELQAQLDGPAIKQVHLRMKNPFVHDYKGKLFRDETYADIIKKAKEAGHDGVILKNTYDAGELSRFDALMRARFKPEDIYVVFEADQVVDANTFFQDDNVIAGPWKKKLADSDFIMEERKKAFASPEMQELRDDITAADMASHAIDLKVSELRHAIEIDQALGEEPHFTTRRQLQMMEEDQNKAYEKLEDAREIYRKRLEEVMAPLSFEQSGASVVRGSITFDQRKTLIRLFRDANLSTLAHESGHLFLQVMTDLVHGQQAYSRTLFQEDTIEIGDVVQLLDDDGNDMLDEPKAIVDIRDHPRLGTMVQVEGSTKFYKADRVFVISRAEAEQLTEAEIVEPEPEEGQEQLARGQMPADFFRVGDFVEVMSGEEKITVFDKPVKITNIFRDKQFATPDNPEGVYIQVEGSATGMPLPSVQFHHRLDADIKGTEGAAEVEQIIRQRGRVKANPLGIELTARAMSDTSEQVKKIVDVAKAAAKIEQALSGRQSERVLKELRVNLRAIEGQEQNDAAWAELEAEIGKISGDAGMSPAVKTVVNAYIEKYKTRKAKTEAKEEAATTRSIKKKEAEETKLTQEAVKEALTELANVVERVEKIEAAREASAELKADLKIIQEWLGESGTVYSTAAQEKFAKGFEAYLFEGVAPSSQLARVFEKFKNWLKLVYRQIANIGVSPTPEVKAVFDRMLTSDRTIDDEVLSAAFLPTFNSPAEAGMTQEEYDVYIERVNSLAQIGKQAADKAIVSEASKLRDKAVLDKKTELRNQYTTELLDTRVYKVMQFLQGKRSPLKGQLEPIKLDRARVVEILGAKKLGTIPGGANMWAKAGGVDPDTVAAMFGWNSGAEMLGEFQNTEPLKTVVEQRVNEEIKQFTDEQLVTPPEVAEMAATKLRSEVYRDFLISELRAFAKLMGMDFTDAHVVQFQRMAAHIIDEKSMRDVLKRNFVKEFTEADRKIGKLIDRAVREKDLVAIADLRKKQLFNYYLVNKAYEAKDTARKAKTYLTSFPKRKANVIDQNYLSQIRNLLVSFGFLKGKIDDTLPAFSQFLDDELDAGAMIVIDPRVKGKTAKPWQTMKWGEVSAIYDAVKNMEFMGRNKRKIFKEGRVLDMRLAVEQIAAAMDTNLRTRAPLDQLNQTGFNKLKGWFNGFIMTHIKIEQLCDWIDGGAAQGPAHRYIFQGMADAQVREVQMIRKYADKIVNILTTKSSSYWSQVLRVDAVGLNIKRSEAMAVALNLGNESNRNKLMKGMGWTQHQIDSVLNLLDKSDWETVQQIWDTIDGLWPDVLELTARLGLPRPDKVEAIPVQTKHGTFRGGYYPVVYDPSKSADVLARGLTTKAEQQFGFEPSSIFPPRSFANDRSDDYARPILLDMTVLPQHVAKVVHYITHAEAVYNTTKIMNHEQFKSRFLRQFGPTAYEHMIGWIHNIAKGETEVAGLSGWQRFARTLRSNITLAALGLRATTVVAQAGGLFAGAEMIGMGNVTRGLREMYGSASIEQIQQNMEFVRSKSGEMRHRTQFLERDLSYVSDALDTTGRVRRKIRDIAMAPMLIADSIFAQGIWMGAYQAQLKKSPHDEKTAIAYADKVVRLTQGSGAAKDLAAVQRGNEFYRLLTMFYTYFSAYQNRLVDTVRTARYRMSPDGSAGNVVAPNELLRYMYLVMLPAITFDFLFKGAMKGAFTDDDEETGDVEDAIWKVFAYTFAGSVGIRDVVNYAARDEAWWKFSGTPVLRSIELVLERLDRMARAAADENKDIKVSDIIRSTTDVAGLTLGLPLDAPSIPIYNYAKAQEAGETFTLSDLFIRR